MSSELKPKIMTLIECTMFDGTKTRARVLSMQPKQGGKYRNLINVHVVGDQKPSSINWDKIINWKEIDDEEQIILLSALDEMNQLVIDAKT